MTSSSSETESAGPTADAEAVLDELLARLDRELGLSPPVRAQVREVLAEHFEAMEPHLAAIAGEPTRSAKIRVARAHREPMQAIRDRADAQLRDLLDEAQYARYEELRRELRDELRTTMQARYGG